MNKSFDSPTPSPPPPPPPPSSATTVAACATVTAPPVSEPPALYEGIGISRLTNNFAQAKVDGAFQGSNQEGVDMCYYLLRNEGLWVGPSAALNVVGAVKLARLMGPGHTIVTVLCDGGQKYVNTVYNQQWLQRHGLEPKLNGAAVDFVR